MGTTLHERLRETHHDRLTEPERAELTQQDQGGRSPGPHREGPDMPQTAGLTHDRSSDRWTLADRDLHCGDGLRVQVAGRWVPCRIEHDERHGWVLYADDDRVRILPSRLLPARPDPRDGRW